MITVNTQQPFPRILWLSLSYNLLLLAVRIVYSGTLKYVFLGWNLFLAFLPLAVAIHITKLSPAAQPWKKLLWLAAWLLLLPNAPYIITDLVHLKERHPIPFYYDVMLLFLSAFNGLLMGLLSLRQLEPVLLKTIPFVKISIQRAVIFVLCGMGVYLGRFGRWNSWDVLTQPHKLAADVLERLFFPWQHGRTWAVTFLFASVLYIAHQLLRQMQSASPDSDAV
jgi:uncharacterized membrane protein